MTDFYSQTADALHTLQFDLKNILVNAKNEEQLRNMLADALAHFEKQRSIANARMILESVSCRIDSVLRQKTCSARNLKYITGALRMVVNNEPEPEEEDE